LQYGLVIVDAGYAATTASEAGSAAISYAATLSTGVVDGILALLGG